MTNVRELCCEVAFILIEGATACAAKVGADDICEVAQPEATYRTIVARIHSITVDVFTDFNFILILGY